MPHLSRDICLRLENGRELSIVDFAAGVEVPPLRVGEQGDWRVSGDGIAPVHLLLAFDGFDVRVAVAAPGLEARLDGTALTAAWARMSHHGEIQFGCARLRMTSSTCTTSCWRELAQRSPDANPARVKSGSRGATERTVWPGAMSAWWRRRSWVGRVSLLALPIAIFVFFAGPSFTRPHRGKSPPPDSPARILDPRPEVRPQARVPAERGRSLVAAIPAAATPASTATASARRAVDAIAAGAFEEAARIYDALAAQTPGNPVYPEAARLARNRIASGQRFGR